jgi:Zn-finger nucleic acid-binding protein
MPEARDDVQLQCPRCIKQMRKQRNQRAVIDHCDECDGNFFDEGEMLAMLGKSADPEVWARDNRMRTPSASDIACPRCHARMQLHPLGVNDIDVDIELCAMCGGIWLDGGEVDAVMQIGARQLAQAAKARAKSKASAKAPPRPESAPQLIGEYLSMFPKPKT